MNAAEMDAYLGALRKELGDLGPLERKRVVRDVRADILELAGRKRSDSTDSGAIQAAIGEMPSAFEVAQEYLGNHGPPMLVTRLAIGLNLLLGMAAFAVAVLGIRELLSASNVWASNLVMILVAIALFVASCATIAVYTIALLSPRTATRWRFGSLPAAGVSLLAGGVVLTVLAVLSSVDPRIAMSMLAGALLGGTYAIVYVYRQLGRFDSQDLYTDRSRDYLRAIAQGIRDLDRSQRLEVLVELRSHIEASGVDISRLEPAARRAKLEETLGSPAEVAAAYAAWFRGALPRVWRRGLIGVLVIAAAGFVAGSVVLSMGLSGSVYTGGSFTFLGLASSVGLLGLAGVLLWMSMRVYRAPPQRTDLGRPIVVVAMVAILLLSAAVLGTPLGALVVQGDVVRHEVLGSVRLEDGGLGVLWYSYDAELVWGPRSAPLGAWVTVVDGSGVVASTEPFPTILPSGPLLDFARSNGSWMALFPDALIVWGASNGTIPMASPTWQRAEGHIEGSVARVAWISASESAVQVDFERIDLLAPSNGLRWEQSISLANATELKVRVSNAAVVVVAAVNEQNATQSRAAVSAHLIPEAGTAATSLLLHERAVSLAAPSDMANGTWIGLHDIQLVDGHFWLSGFAWTKMNGIGVASAWAGHIDIATTTALEWDLQQVSLPERSNPPVVGDKEARIFSGSVASADRLFVASSIYQTIFGAGGDWQPDEAANELLLSSLLPSGAVEYTVRLDQGIPMRSPLFPIVEISQGIPTVLVVPVDGSSVYSIGPIVPPSAVATQSIVLRIGERAVLYRYVGTQHEKAFPLGPSVLGYVGEGFMEDSGFLRWRDATPSPGHALISVPAILLVDFSTGSARFVPFVAPLPRPDVLLDLVLSASSTVLATLLLVVGCPRWHLTPRRRQPG